MSRTKKGSKPCGMDFWGKYRCNKYGASGVGEFAKERAKVERRNDSKELLGESITEMWVDELADTTFQSKFRPTKEELDEICKKGAEVILENPFNENKVFTLWEPKR